MTERTSIAIGCDDAAVELKDTLCEHIADLGYAVDDLGIKRGETVLYPDIAVKVAESIVEGHNRLGVLICGTGIGVAMAANKVPGIRAAQAHDTYSAQRARMSNDAQIVTLGSRVVGPELAKAIVETFLASDFQGGGSTAKVDRIKAYEQELGTQRSA